MLWLLTGYPCCTSNMHQGWPKFTQNLWYAIPDKELAALIYSPSSVKTFVANGSQVSFKEETNYPFDETIKFTLNTNKKTKAATFPFLLRIPEWCKKGTVKINGKLYQESGGNKIVKISREWKSGDVVKLELPMHVFKNIWYENSMSVERGPITYALKIGQNIKKVKNEKDPISYGEIYDEVIPTTPWNYGLIETPATQMEDHYKIEKRN